MRVLMLVCALLVGVGASAEEPATVVGKWRMVVEDAPESFSSILIIERQGDGTLAALFETTAGKSKKKKYRHLEGQMRRLVADKVTEIGDTIQIEAQGDLTSGFLVRYILTLDENALVGTVEMEGVPLGVEPQPGQRCDYLRENFSRRSSMRV